MSDFATLAAGIASQLDGVLQTHDEGGDPIRMTDRALINLQHERAGLVVVLRVGYGAERSRVRATMSQTTESRDGADYRETPDLYRLETAAAMSRGPDVIARQIESKIVQPAIPMLEAWQIKRAELRAELARLDSAMARYRAAFPRASVDKRDPRDTEARFHMTAPHPATGYVTGRVHSDGRFYIDRMSSVSESAAVALLSSLAETIS